MPSEDYGSSGSSGHPEIDVMYLTGNEAETDLLRRSSTPSILQPYLNTGGHIGESTHVHSNIHTRNSNAHKTVVHTTLLYCTKG